MRRVLFFCAIFFMVAPAISAQTQGEAASPYDALLKEREETADRLRLEYRFSEAISAYEALIPLVMDPGRLEALGRKIAEVQRAQVLSGSCRNPEVLAKRTFPLKDFMLYYPYKNGSWRQLPNALDGSAADALVQAVFAPKGLKELYFSGKDSNGCRNLYYTQDRDSLWSAPVLLGESLVTTGDEIFPMLSLDGKTLYFASNGLYGIGGYDLYKSVYDEAAGAWGVPENMGFPYSSPADDFLFIGSEDGKYAIFASNRECSRDSVCLYVMDYTTLDRMATIDGEEALHKVMQLVPAKDPTRMDNSSLTDRDKAVTTDGTLAYREQMNVVRQIKDRIYRYEQAIDALKLALAETPSEALQDSLSRIQQALPVLRDSLETENRKVHEIESSFLKGKTAASDNSDSEVKELVGVGSAYTFTRHTYGTKLKINLASPDMQDVQFDVDPVGSFAQSLPQGTVYQIWFMTRETHATLDMLKGLCPVFERITLPNLHYSYTVGVFPTYQAALSALNSVRMLGFRDCRIVLSRDGRLEEVAKNIANP